MTKKEFRKSIHNMQELFEFYGLIFEIQKLNNSLLYIHSCFSIDNDLCVNIYNDKDAYSYYQICCEDYDDNMENIDRLLDEMKENTSIDDIRKNIKKSNEYLDICKEDILSIQEICFRYMKQHYRN